MTATRCPDRLALGMFNVFVLPPNRIRGSGRGAWAPPHLGCRPGDDAGAAMPPFSVKDDAGLRKELLAAMSDRGVSISLGDGFLVLSAT